MGRARKHRKDLPENVQQKHGAFYYTLTVPAGTPQADGTVSAKPRTRWIHLGRTEADMWVAWREIDPKRGGGIVTVADLLDAYLREVVPTQKPNSARGNVQAAKPLRAALGHIPVRALRPMHLYAYRKARAKRAPVRANRERSTMLAVLNYAIELGLRDDNPARQVKRLPEAPRERLPLAWELEAVMEAGGPLIKAYIPLKLILGLRQGDMLAMTKAQIVRDGPDAGVHVRARKTGKRKIMPWTEALRAAVAAAEAIPRKVASVYVFSTRDGQPYTADGFRSIWHRAMRKALKAGKLQESFTEHDIRAATATEAAELEGMQRAQELLDHSSEAQTAAYVRGKKPDKVRPLR